MATAEFSKFAGISSGALFIASYLGVNTFSVSNPLRWKKRKKYFPFPGMEDVADSRILNRAGEGVYFKSKKIVNMFNTFKFIIFIRFTSIFPLKPTTL